MTPALESLRGRSQAAPAAVADARSTPPPEIRRCAWLGRQAPDPQTAWFVKIVTEKFTKWPVVVIGIAVGLWLIARGVIWFVTMTDAHRPVGVALAFAWLIPGFLNLTLLATGRRAHRLNEPKARMPGS